MGTGVTFDSPRCYDDDCGREIDACGGDLLGELHAATAVFVVLAECQSVSCPNCMFFPLSFLI